MDFVVPFGGEGGGWCMSRWLFVALFLSFPFPSFFFCSFFLIFVVVVEEFACGVGLYE